MLRHNRSILALVAVVGLVAAACGSSPATPTAAPISDPYELIVTSLLNTRTVHVKADVSGQVDPSALIGIGGLGIKFNLANTTVEGDADLANKAFDLKLSAPGLLGATGEAIGVGGYLYTKASWQVNKFTKSAFEWPAGIPIPGTSVASLSSLVAQLRGILDPLGATVTLKGDENVGGKDCYHLSISVPIDKINGMLAQAGGAIGGISLDSATVDYWVSKADVLPARLHVAVSSASLGNLDVVTAFSNHNAQVNIQAPDPNQIAQ